MKNLSRIIVTFALLCVVILGPVGIALLAYGKTDAGRFCLLIGAVCAASCVMAEVVARNNNSDRSSRNGKQK